MTRFLTNLTPAAQEKLREELTARIALAISAASTWKSENTEREALRAALAGFSFLYDEAQSGAVPAAPRWWFVKVTGARMRTPALENMGLRWKDDHHEARFPDEASARKVLSAALAWGPTLRGEVVTP